MLDRTVGQACLTSACVLTGVPLTSTCGWSRSTWTKGRAKLQRVVDPQTPDLSVTVMELTTWAAGTAAHQQPDNARQHDGACNCPAGASLISRKNTFIRHLLQ